MNKIELKYKLWFMTLKASIKEKLELLSNFEDEENIFNNLELILMNKGKNCVYDKFQELSKAEVLENYMEKNNIKFLSYNDCEYPFILKQIPDPPYGLFYKGNIGLLGSRSVAIVGSRNCTNYGVEITKLLTNELNSYNISIISGGARGIDTIAHNNTIFNGGNTIVVLGCGIDVVYPKENYNMFKKIEECGLIISEFLPKTKPFKQNFPYRNRIISGLSELVIVVEAAEKSGSLITATYAAEQGKEVMAVPGLVTSKESKGCFKLLREGSLLYTQPNDLRSVLGLSERNKIESKKTTEVENILSIISNSPTHIDEIVNKSFIDREVLYKVLFEMQIRKEIVSLPGNYYAKII